MTTQAAVASVSPAKKDAMQRFAEEVPALPTGDRALLRRLYLVQSSSSRSYAADGVVVGLLHRANIPVPERVDQYEVWRLVAHVAALLTGTGKDPPMAHDRHKSLGEALQNVSYPELRLLRLTAARGPVLVDQIVRAVRVLSRSDQGQGNRRAVNLWTVFYLASDRAAEAEAARLDIAKSYYDAA